MKEELKDFMLIYIDLFIRITFSCKHLNDFLIIVDYITKLVQKQDKKLTSPQKTRLE